MSTRRGLELLLLLPGRADVAQTVISGTRSHPDCRTGGSKGWFCQSTSLKILRTILGNLYSSLEWGGRAIRPGEKLGIKRSSCLECGKGQKSSGEQRDPRYSLGALWRLCGGHRKSWPYWRSLLERVPGLGNPWSCSQASSSAARGGEGAQPIPEWRLRNQTFNQRPEDCGNHFFSVLLQSVPRNIMELSMALANPTSTLVQHITWGSWMGE